MHKFHHYCIASIFAVSAIIGKEAYTHQQFYTTVVSLTTSKVSRVALYNAAFVLLLLFGQYLRWLFFGELKPREVEKAFEQTCYYVITTCLALTIFREHMNSTIMSLFVLCLFVKTFHWLSQSRQEYIEQTEFEDDSGKWWGYFRLFVLLMILGTVDILMSSWYIWSFVKQGPSVRLLLALEYLVMSMTFFTIFLRLMLHMVDELNHHRWENKGKYKFYLEIFSDLVQCLLYIAFFCIILWFYGIPIHLIRELFVTLRSFKKTIADFIRYRKLIACLDERYPNATEEEIARDPQCIICYDDMNTQAKKLPCGHIFHKHCLKSWMERNNKCPYCNKQTLLDPPRTPVARPQPAPAAPPTEPIHMPATPPTATSSSPPKRTSKTKSSAKSKAKQQQQEQLQQQILYMETWLQQLNQSQQAVVTQTPQSPQPPVVPATSSPTTQLPSSTPSATAPLAPDTPAAMPEATTSPGVTAPPVPVPTVPVPPVSVPPMPIPAISSSSAAWATPTTTPAAFPQAFQQYYSPMYGGFSQPQLAYMGGAGQPQPQPTAPGTPAQAQAYAEFHLKMAAVYTEMAETVSRIAAAYSTLADDLRTAEQQKPPAALEPISETTAEPPVSSLSSAMQTNGKDAETEPPVPSVPDEHSEDAAPHSEPSAS